MPNKNYKRGVAKERKAIEQLESVGYEAMRTAGSHGIFDVIATGPCVRMIQIKRIEKGNNWASEYKREVEKIRQLNKPTGSVTYEYWVWEDYKGWIRQEIVK